MAMSGGVSSQTCQHCGALNVITGFDSVMAFICLQCGDGNKVEHP